MIPYSDIFTVIEQSLIDYGSNYKPRNEIISELNKFKSFENRQLSDDDYFEILVFVAFYSGFKAATVTSKRDIIKKHFPNLQTVASYDNGDVDRILNDDKMIRNVKKINACINNAKKMTAISKQHKGFKNYLDSFDARDSFENIMLLKEELEGEFDYLSSVTVYHFLTDIGTPVLKPDRVISRLFKRLGLIESESQLLKSVIHGRKFAIETGLPIRYIDIVLVAYGQAKSTEFGINKGICLKNPRCEFCGITKYCHYKGIREHDPIHTKFVY